MVASRTASHRKKLKLTEVSEAEQPHRPLISIPLTLLFYWDSVPNPDTPCGLCVLHVFAVANTRTRPVVWWRLVNPANPIFKGAHHGLRAFHRRTAALPANSGPASDDALLLRCSFWTVTGQQQQGCLCEDLPPSALEGGACEAGGPGPHGGFLLLGMTTSVSWKFSPHNRQDLD